jgi:hypothetical protein
MKTPKNIPADSAISPNEGKLDTTKTKQDICDILENERYIEILSIKVDNLDSLVIFNDKANDVISEMMAAQYSL